MTVAIVMTVRDEQELLRSNLLYHHYLGVEHAFVYDDGSNDDTVASVADLNFVRLRPTVSREAFAGRPELAKFVDAYGSHITARQSLNVVDAMDAARAAGATWLAHIDADELLAADLTTQPAGALRSFFDGQAVSVEAIVFPPVEVVQRRLSYDDVLAQETLFKLSEPQASRQTYDPFTREMRDVDLVYGHTHGKSAVRLSAQALPASVHRFEGADGRELATRHDGYVLHYYCHSFAAFQAKFRLMKDHPDRHIRGNSVRLQKRLWRDVVNRAGLTDDELRDYYQRWVMFGPDEIARHRQPRGWGPFRKPAVIVEVDTVREVMASVAGARRR